MLGRSSLCRLSQRRRAEPSPHPQIPHWPEGAAQRGSGTAQQRRRSGDGTAEEPQAAEEEVEEVEEEEEEEGLLWGV